METSTIYRGICLYDPTGRLPDPDAGSDAEILERVKKTYRSRGGMYGSYWTSKRSVALAFALGEAKKSYWWGISDPDRRVLGVVIEVEQRGLAIPTPIARADQDGNKAGEFGVEPPRDADVELVLMHLVSMEAGRKPRRKRWVRQLPI